MSDTEAPRCAVCGKVATATDIDGFWWPPCSHTQGIEWPAASSPSVGAPKTCAPGCAIPTVDGTHTGWCVDLYDRPISAPVPASEVVELPETFSADTLMADCSTLADASRVIAALVRRVSTLEAEREEARRAHAASFGALQAVSMLTDLEGEVDDYSDVVRAAERVMTHRDLLIDAVRLVGQSSWDGAGWNLHVRRGTASALFDVAYLHDARPNPLDGEAVNALRAKLSAFLAALASSTPPEGNPKSHD